MTADVNWTPALLGRHAFLSGRPLSTNPYRIVQPLEAVEWREGWHRAQSERKALLQQTKALGPVF